MKTNRGRALSGAEFSEEERAAFWALVSIKGPDACWPWNGFINKRGYGELKGDRAHRISHAISKEDIPAGLLVCHECDNPVCVNPAHLFIGTDKDNVADMRAKGRNNGHKKFGIKSHLARLTDAQVIAIRSDPRPGLHIAKEYGIGSTTVYDIKHRRSWPHL